MTKLTKTTGSLGQSITFIRKRRKKKKKRQTEKKQKQKHTLRSESQNRYSGQSNVLLCSSWTIHTILHPSIFFWYEIIWSEQVTAWFPPFFLALDPKIQTHKRFQRTLFIRTKHSMQIFGVIPFVKLQNDTQTTVKRCTTITNEMES